MKLIEASTITEPGLYRMAASDYHDDPCPEPSLSSSIARIMLAQSPLHAMAAHPRLNPEPKVDSDPSRPKEIGSAAHAMVLGTGQNIVIIDARDYKTKDAREARAAAYIEGHVPLLEADRAEVERLAATFERQLAEHAGVADWFTAGEPEVVLAWKEGPGFWCRAMIDKLAITGTRAAIFDLKFTETSADPYATGRRAFQMGYDVQLGFYARGLRTLMPELTEVSSFLVTQETSAPYALSVVRFSWEAERSADKEIWKALALWQSCMKSGIWPGYPPVIAEAELPSFLDTARTTREMNDALIGGLDLSPFAPRAREREPSGEHPLMAG